MLGGRQFIVVLNKVMQGANFMYGTLLIVF